MWLILERSGIDVCMRDRDLPSILHFAAISVITSMSILATRNGATRPALQFDGDLQIARAFPV
jgi:hypothetical protein